METAAEERSAICTDPLRSARRPGLSLPRPRQFSPSRLALAEESITETSRRERIPERPSCAHPRPLPRSTAFREFRAHAHCFECIPRAGSELLAISIRLVGAPLDRASRRRAEPSRVESSRVESANNYKGAIRERLLIEAMIEGI